MSPETRYKRSRDNWKQKAACRAEKNRYQSKELARVKAERDRFKKELKESRARAHQLESQSRVVLIQSKVDLVFLALQLFVVARIGFRAVSRVLGLWSQYSVGFGHFRWLSEGPKHLVWKGWQFHEVAEPREYAVGIGLQLFGTRERHCPQFSE